MNPSSRYLYTLRLGQGIATCMAASSLMPSNPGGDSTRFLLGTSGGDLFGVSLMPGGGPSGRSGDSYGEGLVMEEGLSMGLEAYASDDDDDDDELDHDDD